MSTTIVIIIVLVVAGIVFLMSRTFYSASKTGNSFVEIKEAWRLIIDSNDSNKEKIATERFKLQLKEKIPIKAIVIDKDGLSTDYNLYKGKQEDIDKISLILIIEGNEIKMIPDWKPKDINNFFGLFLE